MHSVLTDPTFTVELKSGEQAKCSLAKVYEKLAADEVTSFTHLQAFQVQGWHTFLAQLAAMAVEQHGEAVPSTAAQWEDLLQQMGPPEMWNIETEDLSKPAFCQAPVLDADSIEPGRRADVWAKNILVTSKSHKSKNAVLHNPNQEHYLYWAVNLHQHAQYSGPGYAKTSRLNGGYANRGFLGVTPSLSFGAWVMHDVQVLLDAYEDVSYEYSFTDAVGSQPAYHPEECVLWLIPRPSDSNYYTNYHPYFLDGPRRIRRCEGTWYELSTPDNEGPSYSTDKVGITGDPWAPISREGKQKVMNAGQKEKGYKRLAQMLTSDDWERPPIFTSDATEGYIVLRFVGGGPNNRAHLVERIIPYAFESAQSVTALLNSEIESEATPAKDKTKQRLQLSERAESGLKQVFYHLYSRTLDGSTEYSKSAQALNRQAKQRLHRQIDSVFFEELYTSSRSKEADRAYFLSLLRPIFKEVTDQMISGPMTSQAWKRKAGAQDKQSLYINHYLAD